MASNIDNTTDPAVFPINVPKNINTPNNDKILINNRKNLGGNQRLCFMHTSRHKNKTLIRIIDHAGNLLRCGVMTNTNDNVTQNTGY